MKELICITCPKGCHLKVDEENSYAVTGNRCPRGEEYGRAELVHPTRVVTSTVKCRGGNRPRCPVKTNRPVPKDKIFEIVKALDSIQLDAPVRIGQVILPDVCGTGADIVATKNI